MFKISIHRIIFKHLLNFCFFHLPSFLGMQFQYFFVLNPIHASFPIFKCSIHSKSAPLQIISSDIFVNLQRMICPSQDPLYFTLMSLYIFTVVAQLKYAILYQLHTFKVVSHSLRIAGWYSWN